MIPTLDLPNLREGYVTLVDAVLDAGKLHSPRGMPTYEVENFVFSVGDLRDTLPVRINRGVNLQLAALEALQLIGNRSRPDLLTAVSPNFETFNENLTTDKSGTPVHYGAYGTRIGTQLASVVRKLKDDEASRQAVITLWDQHLDNVPGHLDYPCTVALGFRLRNDQLNLSVTMRSNDVWLGTAYDVFQFTQLQHTVAALLGVETGTYTHMAWSLHLYQADVDLAESISYSRANEVRPYLPAGVDPLYARSLLRGDNELLEPMTENDKWYHDQMTTVRRLVREQTA